MTTTPPSEPAGGDGLLTLISAAVIIIVALEVAFVAFASWLLLPLMMLGVIAAAGLVIFAIARTMENDTPVPVRCAKPRITEAPAPRKAPAVLGTTPVTGH